MVTCCTDLPVVCLSALILWGKCLIDISDFLAAELRLSEALRILDANNIAESNEQRREGVI